MGLSLADRTLYHRSVDDARRQSTSGLPGTHNWKRDETVARILRRWRELSGDKDTRDRQRRTLVACSGGADSVALAFALSRVPGSCVIAHVRHDIRSQRETQLDLELVKSLAEAWGVQFDAQDLAILDKPGNLEANAREGRYAILNQIALEHNCHFIATGHHADDQLETLLMNLMRGSGLRGMSGMPKSRTQEGVKIIRPMLEIEKQHLVSLLERAGIRWCEDETNRDSSHLRNRIRHEVIPSLRDITPKIATRAAHWAEDLDAAGMIISEQVDRVVDQSASSPGTITWERAILRDCPDLLLGMLPHRLCIKLCSGEGLDSISRDMIRAWVRGVKSVATDPSCHRLGPMVCFIDAHLIRFTRASNEQDFTENPR